MEGSAPDTSQRCTTHWPLYNSSNIRQKWIAGMQHGSDSGEQGGSMPLTSIPIGTTSLKRKTKDMELFVPFVESSSSSVSVKSEVLDTSSGEFPVQQYPYGYNNSPLKQPKIEPSTLATVQLEQHQAEMHSGHFNEEEEGELRGDETAHAALEGSEPIEDSFCVVSGRTSLMGAAKYNVTVAELERRINRPECLNAPLLGGLLRRAKKRQSADALKEKLLQRNLELPPGRRRGTPITTFTSLAEQEAERMSQDYAQLCEDAFPTAHLGRLLASQTSTEELPSQTMKVHGAMLVLQSLYDVLSTDGSPTGGRKGSSEPSLLLDQPTQEGLNAYSALTHGFGTPAMLCTLKTLILSLNQQFLSLNQRESETGVDSSDDDPTSTASGTGTSRD